MLGSMGGLMQLLKRKIEGMNTAIICGLMVFVSAIILMGRLWLENPYTLIPSNLFTMLWAGWAVSIIGFTLYKRS